MLNVGWNKGIKAMDINEIKTYDELQDYLLDRMDYADGKKSKINPSFTKNQIWDMYMNECISREGQKISIRTRDLFLKQIKLDFN